jgi:hypothetical protein
VALLAVESDAPAACHPASEVEVAAAAGLVQNAATRSRAGIFAARRAKRWLANISRSLGEVMILVYLNAAAAC